MEEFLNQSKGFLGILQSMLTDKEKENSAEAADLMFEEIRKISEDKELNIREMMNAALAVQAEILQLVIEKTEEMKG
ncbi:hypothetical protein TCA2_4625 [Paenibacillus sp. TCA20]|uniref:Uncharacterized protein n=1 Tax=Paenibacillus urinalis TaxID=521520 RepID=A0ABY7XGV7_9BACL|nr:MULTISPECIES: hypothetical protein [Paenibacillus]WDI05041.1 hypothetical protein PUW25_26085 [Paenibacillus urinalis]GAK42133.1 hypothetical protein TCA2_4625 [Paenibacillus sp. TCA20]